MLLEDARGGFEATHHIGSGLLVEDHAWRYLGSVWAAAFVAIDAPKGHFLLGISLKEGKALL